jgi:hypothetical protein
MNQLWKSRRVRFAAAGAAALTVGLLASLGGVGYAASILGVSASEPVAAQYPPAKVTICHHTHSATNPFVTITVSERALPAHLAHGDTIGACSTPAVAPTPRAAVQSAKKPGKPGHSRHQGKTKKSHPGGQERSTLRNTLKGNGLAQGNENAQTSGQGQVHSQAGTNSHGQGKDHANSHASGHDHGQGQSGTHDQGQGNGQGDVHGNPGDGKGQNK